ncbi:MAG TPA: SRPBCC family protein [bacterium]|nr:SRPBCC family protein [bacterium]
MDPRYAYHFVDLWHLPAPIEMVWPHIRDVKGYPRWWKQFVEARPRNDLNGVGAVVWVHVKAALPYHLYFEIEAVREEPPRLAAARLRGDLNGETMWRLESHGGGTRLILEETVVTGKALLSTLTPLLRPLFAWNHAIAARRGEQGLRRILAAGRSDTPPSAG